MFRGGVCWRGRGFIGATLGACDGGLCRCFSQGTEAGRPTVGEGRPAAFVPVRAVRFLGAVCWRRRSWRRRRPLLWPGAARQGTSGRRRWVWAPSRRAVSL